MPRTSIHARLNEGKVMGSISSAIDAVLEGAAIGGPMQSELIAPLLLAAQQIEQLRSGELGQLDQAQREALNVAHGRLSQVVAALREMDSATAAAGAAFLPGGRVSV